ncbi:MAG: pyridoxal phosphate-dependent aminotransferase [Sphingomonas sp.]|nr:pyridoxal phosphate-dependent aminotransferase [Sphingomonas sp.]
MTGRIMQSDYMHWAKFKPAVRYPLSTSEVPHFRMDTLGIDLADLNMDGASHPRYATLRERIAERYGVAVEQVVAADGASMANFLAMAALLEPGDEVLVEFPTYEPLLGAASFLGAEIKRFERKAADAFRLDPALVKAAMSERTKLIVLTNLHNPSGALAEDAQLLEIAKFGARVLIDEVYLDAAQRRSAVHLGSQFVVTNSLTKVYGLSGLRCGWILAEPDVAERMWRLNDLFGVNQAHQAERLACIAFDNIDKVIGDTPAMLRRNRDLFNHFITGRDDLDCAPAVHGVTAFPRWSGSDTERLNDHLRERYDTAVVPGRWFEMPDHFRIGFGLPNDDFTEGLSRLGRTLGDLR